MAAERFVDTNVFLRHLLQDQPTHGSAATALLRRMEDRESPGWTSWLVFAEMAWVLEGPGYRRSRADIRAGMESILQMSGLRIDDRPALTQAIDRWATTRIDFIDCLHAAIVEALDPPELYSFDRDFDRIPEVTRIEP